MEACFWYLPGKHAGVLTADKQRWPHMLHHMATEWRGDVTIVINGGIDSIKIFEADLPDLSFTHKQQNNSLRRLWHFCCQPSRVLMIPQFNFLPFHPDGVKVFLCKVPLWKPTWKAAFSFKRTPKTQQDYCDFTWKHWNGSRLHDNVVGGQNGYANNLISIYNRT